MLVRQLPRGSWLELRLDRSAQRNALSTQLADDFEAGLRQASGLGPAVLVGAEGPVFCAGADLKEAAPPTEPRPAERMTSAMLSSGLVTVTMIDGPVYGDGIGLVAASTVVIAGPRAEFVMPEVKLGIFPQGVLPWLEGLVPSRRLFELAWTGAAMDAEEAARHGVVTTVVDSASVPAYAASFVEAIVASPDAALHASRYWATGFADRRTLERVRTFSAALPSPGTPGALGEIRP